MANQEAPQGLHRPSKEYAVALYLAALGGSIIATIGDLLTNHNAAAAVKINEMLRKYMGLSSDNVLIAVALLAAMACFLCWVHRPLHRLDAFYRGVAVFAALSITTPYELPKGVSSTRAAAAAESPMAGLFQISTAHAAGLAAVIRLGRVLVKLKGRTSAIEAIAPVVTIRDAQTGELLGRERVQGPEFEITRPTGSYILELDVAGYRRTKTYIDIGPEPKGYEIPIDSSPIPLGIQRLYVPREVKPFERELPLEIKEAIKKAVEEALQRRSAPWLPPTSESSK